MGGYVRQRLLDSVDNLTEESEETDDDGSDDNANTSCTVTGSRLAMTSLVVVGRISPCPFSVI